MKKESSSSSDDIEDAKDVKSENSEPEEKKKVHFSSDENDDSESEHNTGIPWNDKAVVNSNTDARLNLPGLSFSMMDRLSQILERYIYWCNQVHIFNRESI